MSEIKEIEQMFDRNNRKIFPKHINYIRFPFYKNYEKDLKINFDFPITFITGTNGTGKSSLLHALYGSPLGNSISEFWFNTALDPINDLKDQRHCFICGFKTLYTRSDAEILKTRIKRVNKATGNDDLDYWEPARPSKKYNMDYNKDYTSLDKREASSTRWKLQEKKVYYMDFRYSLSAFDKYFYFGLKPTGNNGFSKQDVIRKHSQRIKNAFNHGSCQRYYNRQASAPSLFTQDAIKATNEILGKNYLEAKILEHNFFDNHNGFAIKYKTDDLSYSEAYAGSGEIAVAKLVNDLLNVEENSLILLDEPETSLHPSAQKKLINFIINRIKIKKLQVVISTHSPDVLEGMPPRAIKVFYENPVNRKINVHENVHANDAFVHIGHSLGLKKIIIVEDHLAKMIVDKVISVSGSEKMFDVEYSPGGESTIKQENMVVYSKTDDFNRFILFDGDQAVEKFDFDNLPPKEKTVSKLKEVVKKLVNQNIKFTFNSEENHDKQELKSLEQYIKYHRSNVFFLPKRIPEEIIWDEKYARKIVDSNDIDEVMLEEDMKKRFNLIANSLFEDTSANGQLKVYEMFIRQWSRNQESLEFIKITEILEKIKAQ